MAIGRAMVATLLAAVLAAGCAATEPQHTTPDTGPATSDPADAAVVHTAEGVVRGLVADDHRLFAGIPYAAPPLGALRWQAPQPAQPWQGERDATRSGPVCVQESDPELGSEDCLTLNVWTPAVGEADQLRPVMVWIHGGGFINGSGDVYDARWLASRGQIVVVTLNYRLGALGFLAHPALGAPGEVGNYGLADQQAALRWVRDNIADFGGDPAKVTIAGESAGAMSVCDHLVAPDSVGLYRAAIIQSGPCQAQVDLVTAQRISTEFAAAVGCADPDTAAQCLRALPAGKLNPPPWYVHFGGDGLSGPVTGTATLPVDPVEAFADGAAAPVPVLIGSNRDEFTLFAALRYLRTGSDMTAQEFPEVLRDTVGVDDPDVLTRYPLDRYDGNASLAYAAAAGDDFFACATDRITDGLARGDAAVYAYEFDDPDAPAPDLFAGVPFPLGATHSLEMRYLFDVGGAPALDAAQQRLSEQMIDYWSRFVRTGAPGGAGQPAWPAVGADPGSRMSLRTDGSRVISTFEADHQCAYWNTVRR